MVSIVAEPTDDHLQVGGLEGGTSTSTTNVAIDTIVGEHRGSPSVESAHTFIRTAAIAVRTANGS